MTRTRTSRTETAPGDPPVPERLAQANAHDAAFRAGTGRARRRDEAVGAPLRRLGSLFETVLQANAAIACERGGAQGVVFGWLDAVGEDAFAAAVRHPRRPLMAVGLAVGLPALLADAFGALFCESAVMPGVGDPGGEGSRLGSGGSLASRLVRLRSGARDGAFDLQDESFRPADPARAHASQVCALLATEFLFLHQCQHVFGGHATAAAALSDRPYAVLAGGPRPVDAECRLERLQHEIHADTWAAMAMAGLLCRGSTVLLTPRDLDALALEPVHALGLAIVGAFLVEAELAGATGDASSLDHPPPLVRWAAISSVVAANLTATDASVAWRAAAGPVVADARSFQHRLRPVHPFIESLAAEPDAADGAASDLLDSMRIRRPQLRWMHELTVLD